jgi:phenylacetate-CoA ligase
MIERASLAILLFCLRAARRVLQTEPRLFALLAARRLQPMLAWVGRAKAYRVYRKARRSCPAYAAFLREHHVPAIRNSRELSLLPATTKENYVRKYAIEERCYGGKIPAHGVVIDESSGSSGVPNSWVRGPAERSSVKAMMQISYALMFRESNFFILNCFALGPWATGMNVSMSLVDVAIMKSIGPDKVKLENALRQFGTKYRYLIAGYPPFVKNFVDTTTLNLADYQLHLIVGGEGMSEGLREYFSRFFKSVFSSYGASDLEINIGAETEFTVALRKACARDGTLSKELFGREDPPMIFQYSPMDYVIEADENGELIFTIARAANVAPKLRYNLHDRGGVYRHAELSARLKKLDVDLATPARPIPCFPILYVYGRNDLTAPFFGAKIFTSDIESIIYHDPRLAKNVNSFQMRSIEDERLNRRLQLSIERSEASREPLDALELRQIFYDGLIRVNQDFREITRIATPDHLDVAVYDYGEGPFAGRDIRVKCRYIGE